MARLAEGSDSDSEFPDLKDILKGVNERPRPAARREKTPASTSKSNLGDGKSAAVQRKGRAVTALRDTTTGKDEEMGERKDVSDTVYKCVKKKRVLGKRDDNPLLRPIGTPAREENIRSAISRVNHEEMEGSTKNLRGRKAAVGKAIKAAPFELEDELDGFEDPSGREASIEPERARATKIRSTSLIQMKSRKRESHLPEPQKHSVPNGTFGSVATHVRDSGRKDRKEFEKICGGSTRARDTVRKVQDMNSMDPPKSVVSTGRDKAQPTTINIDSEESPAGVDGSKTLPSRKALSTNTRIPTAEAFWDSKGSKVEHMKRLQAAIPTGMGTAESTTIDLDCEDGSLGEVDDSEVSPEPVPRKSRNHREPPRIKSKFILTDTEGEDSLEDEDSEGMSDFIVSDNELLEEDDEESVFEVPAPTTRSGRKLFRGRRSKTDASDSSDLDEKMRRLKVHDVDLFSIGLNEDDGQEENVISKKLPTTSSTKLPPKHEVSMEAPPKTKKSKDLLPSSDIEDPFTLRFSPSDNKRQVSISTRFTTPPRSLNLVPCLMPSPSKLPRIPSSPHRQSSDAFWSQDVINDWNDEYSPRKTPKPNLKPLQLGDGTLLFSPKKSSPMKQGRLAKDAKKAFSKIKHEMAESFLKELDEKITHGKIAEMAASTGGVNILWSKKLNTTAGRANWKRETIRPKFNPSTSSAPPAPTFRHHASIELAEKVIDDEERLLNVIAHEFCHLANFMVSDIRTNPHGKEFKAWAAKCSAAFRDRGIEVTTKHSYEIEYKYVWECENCGLEYKRHSKSIDVAKHRCGVCKSKLVQVKPVPRGGKDGDGGRSGVNLNGYQAFVKENMKIVRAENPGSPQKEIMGLVGKRYQQYKATKLEQSTVESVEVAGSKEGTPEEDSAIVVRKLDFLDLTSP